jgi:hypothetical protein
MNDNPSKEERERQRLKAAAQKILEEFREEVNEWLGDFGGNHDLMEALEELDILANDHEFFKGVQQEIDEDTEYQHDRWINDVFGRRVT